MSKMSLRKLRPEDAPLMLEWMHDPSVVSELATDFSAKTLDDCLRFIASAQDGTEDVHLAIADENGKYMGTVSLKHIRDGRAEFAITVRKCAMGRGFAAFGMKKILSYGTDILHLNEIYWCVARTNTRAVRFYDKHAYLRIPAAPAHLADFYAGFGADALIWYRYPK